MTKTKERTRQRENPTVPVTIRISPQALKLVEAIQIDRGDEFRSMTLAVAVDEFIDRNLRAAS